jgi:hypothetical protein
MDSKHPPPVLTESALEADPRWQLIQRIIQTDPFQKSMRVSGLLLYLAKSSLMWTSEGMSEHRIGVEVFGKPADYTPAEDSVVRVHARQLRLRLHEYFNSTGHDEPIIVELPKGGYSASFHSATSESSAPFAAEGDTGKRLPNKSAGRPLERALLVLALVIAVICGVGWYHAANKSLQRGTTWPLNEVMGASGQTMIVVSDAGYILRMLGDGEVSLDQYVSRQYIKSVIPAHMEKNEARLIDYLSVSQLTSVADVLVTTTLVRLAGPKADQLVVRSARDFNRRDLDHGNFVFIGASTSNPWASLFDNRLNFVLVEDGVGGRRYIRNRKPKPGEQEIYQVPENTGSSGTDFATLSLLPNESGTGRVLIIQGLRHEGTEAVGMLLSDDASRNRLRQLLGASEDPAKQTYFEALIEAQSVAGAPVTVNILATRVLRP